MGNVAASGGYWVAAAGDHIMAEPSTITGSIGIFAMLPSFENAANKWGVNADGVGTTPLTGEPDIINGFSDDFNTIMQSTLEDNYGHFINLVAKSRGKTADQIDTIAQGRVWDGGTARQHGLVDSFGSLDDALKKAAELAKIDKDTEYFAHFLVDEDQGFERFLMDALKGNNVYSGQSVQQKNITDLASYAAMKQRIQWQNFAQSLIMMQSGEGVQAYCLACMGQSETVTMASDELINGNMLMSLFSAFNR